MKQMAASCTKQVLHGLLITGDGSVADIGLDGSRKAAAVYPANAIIPQHGLAHRKGDGNILVLDILIGVYVLQILERGCAGLFHKVQKPLEILLFQCLYLVGHPVVFLHKMQCPQ